MVELGGGKYLIINGNSTLLAVEPLDFVKIKSCHNSKIVY